MTSTKPYLLRAFFEWIVDNNFTPYMVVDAEQPYVKVPSQYIEDGRIVLNISPTAANALLMTNETVEFDARFSGVAMHVVVPLEAVIAIYARENGRGMVFGEEEGDSGDGTEPPTPPSPKNQTKSPDSKSKKTKAPHLKVVK